MLLSTGLMVAQRCPLCGRFSLHALSLFSFVRGRPLRINCGCGFNKMVISSAAHKNYLVRIACLACPSAHHVRLSRKAFWADEVHRFHCSELGTEIAYLGPEPGIHQAVEEGRANLDSIVNDLGFDDFYYQPQIMLEVLGHLHFLAENGNLKCQCGNRQIEANVFPDKLELRCVHCASLLIVYAETQEDLGAVRRKPRIIMSERGFASIDATKLSQER